MAQNIEKTAVMETSPQAPPPWPPRPVELADWPVKLRQRWGDLANRYEADGLDWIAAERRAFEEVQGSVATEPAVAGDAIQSETEAEASSYALQP